VRSSYFWALSLGKGACLRRVHISWRLSMSWFKPVVCEVCIGLEINDYFPAEI
jgi:coenzyme PQQ precursor peptide PqqA